MILHKRINNISTIIKNTMGTRRYFGTTKRVMAIKTAKEISIPVPYGCIAGKLWNEGGHFPIIGLHGWMDNAGAWDGIAPLLPENMCLISIDFPGHGFSTLPLANGSTHMDFVLVIERVMRHFGLQEVNFLTHSMGGSAAFLYAAIFPKRVKKFVQIDTIKPISVEPDRQSIKTAKTVHDLLEAESKLSREPLCYDYEAILDRMMKGYKGELTEESAKILLKRSSKRNENGLYSFCFDPRIKVSSVLSMTFEQQKAFARKLECEMMIFKGSKGTWYEEKALYDEMLKVFEETLKVFRYITLEGNHYIHINNPEVLAPLIMDFFQQ